LSKRIKSTIGKLDELMMRAVMDNDTEVIDANTAQLSTGKDSLGDFLAKYESEDYAQFKQAIGSKAPHGVADLKLTGDFHSDFMMKRQGDEVLIRSKDEKAPKLERQYGLEIYGIAPEQLPEVAPLISESLTNLLRNELL
jgi:hypothetical protein